MPARSSATCGARTGLLAMPSQSTRAKVSPLQTRKRSGSSMITFSGQILPTWPYIEWSISASPSGWYACSPEEGSGEARAEPDEVSAQQLRKVIQRKLVAYKRQDAAKGLRFNLKVDHILRLKEAQSNRCAACNIELLWAYQPKDTQQFSVDRLDNTMGHIRDNTRLTCLECNR